MRMYTNYKSVRGFHVYAVWDEITHEACFFRCAVVYVPLTSVCLAAVRIMLFSV